MPDYFNLRVELLYVEPPIWRRFLIRKDATFLDLHDAIQDACGWEDDHLFAFYKKVPGHSIAGIPSEPDPDEPDAEEVTLDSYFTHRGPKKCMYLYDFGDSWLHEVRLLGTVKECATFRRRLEDGDRSFPPEDCGSIPGYQRCVAVLKTRDDAERLAWIGDWRPDAFDLQQEKARFDR